MPTYQYACTKCGHELEAVQKFTDEPLTVCPECQGRLRKRYTAVGVVFKGSGFYKTDSRSKTTATKSCTSASEPAASSASTSSTSATPSSSSPSSSSPSSSSEGSGGSGGRGGSGGSGGSSGPSGDSQVA